MLGDIASEGDRVKTLEALRDRLARQIDDCEPRDLAPLARRLEAVLAEIDGLKEFDDGDLDDELERRRLAKQGGVAGTSSAGS